MALQLHASSENRPTRRPIRHNQTASHADTNGVAHDLRPQDAIAPSPSDMCWSAAKLGPHNLLIRSPTPGRAPNLENRGIRPDSGAPLSTLGEKTASFPIKGLAVGVESWSAKVRRSCGACLGRLIEPLRTAEMGRFSSPWTGDRSLRGACDTRERAASGLDAGSTCGFEASVQSRTPNMSMMAKRGGIIASTRQQLPAPWSRLAAA